MPFGEFGGMSEIHRLAAGAMEAKKNAEAAKKAAAAAAERRATGAKFVTSGDSLHGLGHREDIVLEAGDDAPLELDTTVKVFKPGVDNPNAPQPIRRMTRPSRPEAGPERRAA